MCPLARCRASTVSTGSASVCDAALRSNIVRSAGEPMRSTTAAASATVLSTGVSARDSGSMQ